ncbi:MAG: TasA family protein [Candidatus Paceibacterota bacterium]|jgi:predicted ribosomally synthesized peptide with SipW-like signal peptide
MKKIILSLSAIALVAVVAVSATTALFSDTETSTGNTISAGTLDLKIDDNDLAGTAVITVANVVPGGSEDVSGTITNAGSIDGSLTFAVTQTSNDDNGLTEPEQTGGDSTGGPGEGDLCATMQVKVDYNSVTVYGWNSLAGLSTPLSLGSLSAGADADYTLSYKIPDTVGNEIQGDSCGFGITATLTQI